MRQSLFKFLSLHNGGYKTLKYFIDTITNTHTISH